MPTERRLLNGRVELGTHERWHDFARAQGVTVAGLLEAMGQLLPGPEERLPPWLRRVVALASAVDDERGDRRPDA